MKEFATFAKLHMHLKFTAENVAAGHFSCKNLKWQNATAKNVFAYQILRKTYMFIYSFYKALHFVGQIIRL